MTKISRPHTEAEEPHWVEWATGIFSAVLVVAMLGWVLYEAVWKEETLADFAIEVKTVQQSGSGYRVEFDIINKATTTAAGVTVRGEVLDGSNVVDDAEVTFDYVAAQSHSSGAMIFSENPANRKVDIRATGYTEP